MAPFRTRHCARIVSISGASDRRFARNGARVPCGTDKRNSHKLHRRTIPFRRFRTLRYAAFGRAVRGSCRSGVAIRVQEFRKSRRSNRSRCIQTESLPSKPRYRKFAARDSPSKPVNTGQKSAIFRLGDLLIFRSVKCRSWPIAHFAATQYTVAFGGIGPRQACEFESHKRIRKSID